MCCWIGSGVVVGDSLICSDDGDVDNGDVAGVLGGAGDVSVVGGGSVHVRDAAGASRGVVSRVVCAACCLCML